MYDISLLIAPRYPLCSVYAEGWDIFNSELVGSLLHVSPEQVAGQAYTSAVDVWAMGVLLYRLLVGEPPFYDTQPRLLLAKVGGGWGGFASVIYIYICCYYLFLFLFSSLYLFKLSFLIIYF